MSSVKIAITLDRNTLRDVNNMVSKNLFPSRSRAIQLAAAEKLARIGRTRLAAECAKLDPKFEQSMADEGLGKNLESWPAY